MLQYHGDLTFEKPEARDAPRLSAVDNNVAGLRSIQDDHIATKVL